MKHLLAVAVLAAAVAALALGQMGDNAGKTKSKGKASVEQALMQMERDWSEAGPKKDAATLDKILADDWVAQTSDGTQTKAEALAELKSLDYKLDSVTQVGDMNVRIFGDIAVVTGRQDEKSSNKGKDTSGRYIWTDVFVKRQGRWQAVASQWGLMAKQ